MATKPTGFRFSDETLAQLDYLCSVAGQSRSALLTALVSCEYDKLMGNPQLQAVAAQMKELEKQMRLMIGDAKV